MCLLPLKALPHSSTTPSPHAKAILNLRPNCPPTNHFRLTLKPNLLTEHMVEILAERNPVHIAFGVSAPGKEKGQLQMRVLARQE
jgi:hypothetical protein